MQQKLSQIQKEYNLFYKFLKDNGRFATKETEVGRWGVSVIEDIYSLFKEINLSKYKKFLDLGSGDGRVVLIASLFTNATGIEFDDELFNKSNEIRNNLKSKAKFVKGNYFDFDIGNYDIIFISPDKGFHEKVEDKLLKEMNKKLIVYNAVFKPRFLKEIKTINFDGALCSIYKKR